MVVGRRRSNVKLGSGEKRREGLGRAWLAASVVAAVVACFAAAPASAGPGGHPPHEGEIGLDAPFEDNAAGLDESAGKCGKPGQPACPLQQWMRKNLAKPLASNDLAAVAASLDAIATRAPDPAWASWATYAQEGAAAARAGDVAKARKACSGCHGEWRKLYRDEYRSRPVPAAGH